MSQATAGASAGVFPRLPWKDYFALDALNGSLLASIADSPYEYQHRRQVPREDTDYFRVGRALHSAIFEPDTYSGLYAGTKLVRNVKHKAYQEFLAENPTKTILKMDDFNRALLCSKALRKRSKYVSALLDGEGFNEITYVWTTGGRVCKTRLDRQVALPQAPPIILDLKSSRKGLSAASFARTIASLGYHWKAAWHIDAVTAATGVAPEHYYFLVVNPDNDSFPAALYRLEDEAIAHGRAEYNAMLYLLDACEAAGHWPDRTETPLPVGIPSWHRLDLVPPPEVAS